MKAAPSANSIQPKSVANPTAQTVAEIDGACSVERTFKAIHACARFTPSAALDAFKHIVVKN